MAAGHLSERERRFVAAYMGEANGNGNQAAIIAGYKPHAARQQASQVLTRPRVRDAIAAARKALEEAAIADRAERQRFLTTVMRSGQVEPRDRLKACDQLSKVQGDYIEKHEHSGPGGAPIQQIVHEYPSPAPDLDAPTR